MSKLQSRFAGFRISIGSVLAAFLLVGAIQAVIMGIRYPIAAGVGWLGNWMARKFHTDLLIFQQGPQWENCAFNLVIALLFFAAFVWVARRAARMQQRGGEVVSM